MKLFPYRGSQKLRMVDEMGQNCQAHFGLLFREVTDVQLQDTFRSERSGNGVVIELLNEISLISSAVDECGIEKAREGEWDGGAIEDAS